MLFLMKNVSQILGDIERGEPEAANLLLPLVYDELRRLSSLKLAREAPGHTLQTTALVHEAYVRLVGGERQQRWQDLGHFFAAAAEAMRRILVENARRKRSLKRGSKLVRRDFDVDAIAVPELREDLLALNEALEKLGAIDPVKAELVKLRYFAGLTSDEAAEILKISPTTAQRYWAYARAWLFKEMSR